MFRFAVGTRAAALPAAVAAAVLATAMPASATPPDTTPELAVTVVTANGSGCPQSTATAEVLPDGTSFTVAFHGNMAWTGDGAAPTDFRANCQLSFQISQPEGMTYAVAEADYSGFALLDDGVTGVQMARYYFQGQPSTTSASHRFTGEVADNWQTTDVFAVDRLVFAPCWAQRNLAINTELRVTPRPADAGLNAMVMDPSFTVHLVWQACP